MAVTVVRAVPCALDGRIGGELTVAATCVGTFTSGKVAKSEESCDDHEDHVRNSIVNGSEHFLKVDELV